MITHEHIDHIRGLGVISRAYGIPIYATEATIEEIKYTTSLGTLDYGLFHSIRPDEPFMVGNIEVRAHSTWHDAADPVCYSLLCEEKKIAVATDMGGYDGYMIQALKDADALLVEANHDIRMLRRTISVFNQTADLKQLWTFVQRSGRETDPGCAQ